MVIGIKKGQGTEKGGSGKWKPGQVGVTKHGICTLLFQKTGSTLCMWGDVHVCIRRILRMWDPGLVCNPMQDPSLPTIRHQWRGASALWREVWLTHFCLLGKVGSSNADSALRGAVFYAFHGAKIHWCALPCKKNKQKKTLCNLELFLFPCHWEVTWMSTSPVPPRGVPLTSPDLLPSDGTWGHHDSSRGQ